MSCAITEWGTAGWKLLHCAAATYPATPTPSDRENMMNFLKLFAWALPCKICGNHFAELMRNADALNPNNSMYDSSEALFAWVNSAHNTVNRRLRKPEVSLSNALRGLYDAPRHVPKSNQQNRMLIRLVAFVLAVVFAAMCYYVSQHYFPQGM